MLVSYWEVTCIAWFVSGTYLSNIDITRQTHCHTIKTLQDSKCVRSYVSHSIHLFTILLRLRELALDVLRVLLPARSLLQQHAVKVVGCSVSWQRDS